MSRRQSLRGGEEGRGSLESPQRKGHNEDEAERVARCQGSPQTPVSLQHSSRSRLPSVGTQILPDQQQNPGDTAIKSQGPTLCVMTGANFRGQREQP